MVTIFCRLERIGGISGKRIQIRRIEKIEKREASRSEYSDTPERFIIFEENKSDVLKVKFETIDLDRFMELLKAQSKPIKELNEYYDINANIILLEYKGGEVTEFGLIKITEIIKKIPLLKEKYRWFLNLREGNYPFEVDGLYAKII